MKLKNPESSKTPLPETTNMIYLLIQCFYFYLSVGFVFALWFVAGGVSKLDEGMHGVSWKLRLLIFPGAVLLWPVLMKKYFTHR